MLRVVDLISKPRKLHEERSEKYGPSTGPRRAVRREGKKGGDGALRALV
jgi:hypothetical protein